MEYHCVHDHGMSPGPATSSHNRGGACRHGISTYKAHADVGRRRGVDICVLEGYQPDSLLPLAEGVPLALGRFSRSETLWPASDVIVGTRTGICRPEILIVPVYPCVAIFPCPPLPPPPPLQK